MSNGWRRSIAALADPVRRQVYAQLVLDARTSESSEIRLKMRERALSALSNARLIEPEINERLAPFTDDVATLRRYMVDERLLFREPDGRSYERRPSA